MSDPPSSRAVKHKVPTENYISMFRMAARHHGEMISAGYNDNMGAIHSAERILNILGSRLIYPALSHGNNLRRHDWADRSIDAQAAIANSSAVKIEHVSPIRDFTRGAISLIKDGGSDDDLRAYVKEHYQLVLLTPEEALRLNGINRSKMTPNRLGDAGIKLAPKPSVEPVARACLSTIQFPDGRPLRKPIKWPVKSVHHSPGGLPPL